jgi:hypothetical protein
LFTLPSFFFRSLDPVFLSSSNFQSPFLAVPPSPLAHGVLHPNHHLNQNYSILLFGWLLINKPSYFQISGVGCFTMSSSRYQGNKGTAEADFNPIGHSLANQFIQNRNRHFDANVGDQDDSALDQTDVWATGGEHLSTNKLSLMLNDMQVSKAFVVLATFCSNTNTILLI